MTSTFLVTKGSQFSPCWLSGLTDHGKHFLFFSFSIPFLYPSHHLPLLEEKEDKDMTPTDK